jgi:hypothetical protein
VCYNYYLYHRSEGEMSPSSSYKRIWWNLRLSTVRATMRSVLVCHQTEHSFLIQDLCVYKQSIFVKNSNFAINSIIHWMQTPSFELASVCI